MCRKKVEHKRTQEGLDQFAAERASDARPNDPLPHSRELALQEVRNETFLECTRAERTHETL
jgi:hypothetical protein